MKKFIIALAAVAAFSTTAFADNGFTGSSPSNGSGFGNASNEELPYLPLIKKGKLHRLYVQSSGSGDQGAIGYLSKDTNSGASSFAQ